MKSFVFVLMVLFSVSCSQENKEFVKSTQGQSFLKICIEGVTYLSHERKMSVMLDRNSKVIPCE